MPPAFIGWGHFAYQKGLTMDFEELLNSLRNPGEDGVPDTIYDDLSASYTESTSTRDAKIGESETALAAALAEIQRVKAMNYDLLMAQGVEESTDDGEPEPEPDDSSDVGDESDFFETEEDK